MRRKLHCSRWRHCAPALFVLLAFAYTSAPCAVVSEREAVAVADLWYAMELNSGQLKMGETARLERLALLGDHTVAYLASNCELREQPPEGGITLAYVVTYEPSGFVVVAGDDRMAPIAVFDAESEFRWDHPELNFFRHFLCREMPRRWNALTGGVHPGWADLRARLGESPAGAGFGKGDRDVYILLDTALWNQGWPYNVTVVNNNGGISGIPAGCTATAMAIKMRFHTWPTWAIGTHSYDDEWGDVQYHHSVDFGATTYTWENMPAENITSVVQDIADLMYHCGVAVDMDYEVGASGAWPTAASMDGYFRYRGTWQVTSGHEVPMRQSILGGLPVVCSSTDHTVVADGYRDTMSPYYHLNCGWGGSGNGWYLLYSQFPGGDDTSIDASLPYSSPETFVYVDATYGGTIYDGTMGHPYIILAMGAAAVPWGGQLWIRGGAYSSPVTFDTQMTIRSWEGTATVGGKLSLTTSGLIKTYGAGEMVIH